MLRSWDLSLLTIKDTSSIFRKGKLAILKCLLKVRKLFMESDPRYILNQLYLDDLCVWIQFVKEEKIKLLADAIEKVHSISILTNSVAVPEHGQIYIEGKGEG